MIHSKMLNNVLKKSFTGLGTLNHIFIYNHSNKSVLEKAYARIVEIEGTMSVFNKNSDVCGINFCAGHCFFPIHNETLEVLAKALEISEKSHGAFDITINPLVNLWGFGKKINYIPDDTEIENALKYVNYKFLELDRKNSSAMLTKAGQSLNLGGIAKGFAADIIKRILEEEGVQSGIINLGGNVVVFGESPEGGSFKVGIQNPLAARGHYLGVLTLTDKTVVTSSCNENFFIRDGVRYHHILDPLTGKPANSGLLSVTAVCSSSMVADALTTAVFVMGIEKGIELANSLGAELVCVTDNLEVLASEGLRNSFQLC